MFREYFPRIYFYWRYKDIRYFLDQFDVLIYERGEYYGNFMYDIVRDMAIWIYNHAGSGYPPRRISKVWQKDYSFKYDAIQLASIIVERLPYIKECISRTHDEEIDPFLVEEEEEDFDC